MLGLTGATDIVPYLHLFEIDLGSKGRKLEAILLLGPGAPTMKRVVKR